MKRAALMFANDELAETLAAAIDEHVDGWTADAYTATVYEEARADHVQRCWDVARGDYDVIQADELMGNGPAAQAIGWATGTPVAGYLRGWGDYTNDHGQHAMGLRAKVRAKTHVLTRSMDGMAAISNAVVAGVSDDYPAGDIRVLERPYDVTRYAGGDGGLFDRRTILTTTNLRYREKFDGVKAILRGLTPIFERTDRWSYAIAGGGQYRTHLEAFVDDYEHSDRVTVLGYRDDVPDLLASADLFAYVSFLDGAPSTVYEAQAAGLPVIGGDSAGVPEAVGDAGIVCPPTPRGITRSVQACLDQPERWQALSIKSQQKMATHNERVANEWATFWEGLL